MSQTDDSMPAPLQLQGADGSRLELHRQGAHLSRWLPPGEDHNRLYLSPRSEYRRGVAIRGGVPVIFPQFAAEGPLPKHGFARSVDWTLEHHDGASARLSLQDSAATHAIWPHRFQAELEITAAGRELALTLIVRNAGDDVLGFTVALHTYLAVEEIGQVRLRGLQGLRYRDSANGGLPCVETAECLRFAGEVDRIYFDTPPALELEDGNRRGLVHQKGFRDTVIWNPGPAKAAALADLEAGGERRMLCIESATIGTPVHLAPGAQWRGSQRIVLG